MFNKSFVLKTIEFIKKKRNNNRKITEVFGFLFNVANQVSGLEIVVNMLPEKLIYEISCKQGALRAVRFNCKFTIGLGGNYNV